jgi:hypothetical protein
MFQDLKHSLSMEVSHGFQRVVNDEHQLYPNENGPISLIIYGLPCHHIC